MPVDPHSPRDTAAAIRITLHQVPGDGDADTQRERALDALALALALSQSSATLAWSIRLIPGRPLVYDILPLAGQVVHDESMRALLAALRSQPQVASAELLLNHQ